MKPCCCVCPGSRGFRRICLGFEWWEIFQVRVNNCYCRFVDGVTASGTRECEPASVSASPGLAANGGGGGLPSKHKHHVCHQTSQLHPIITNIEYLLYTEHNCCIVLPVTEQLASVPCSKVTVFCFGFGFGLFFWGGGGSWWKRCVDKLNFPKVFPEHFFFSFLF